MNESNSTSRRANRGVGATRTLCQGSKCANILNVNGHNAVRKAYGSLGGTWEMGKEGE
jgi:hypothetical protein